MDPNLELCKELVSKFAKARAVNKRKITVIITKMKESKANNTLTKDNFDKQNTIISDMVKLIKLNDDEIVKLFECHDMEELDPDFFAKEIDSQALYHYNLDMDLAEFSAYNNRSSGNSDTPNVSNIDKTLDRSGSKSDPPRLNLPILKCTTFSGTPKDTTSFNIFYNQFMNVIGLRSEFTNATKLSYLTSYLSDYALKVVSHLSIIDDNYLVALELLKKEFLNKNLIIAEAYDFIINNFVSNSYDLNFAKTRNYINDVRGMIFELKNHGLDFMVKDTPGNSLLGHIFFNNLPLVFKRQLILVLNNNYPSLDQIFDNYQVVVETLLKTSKVSGVEKNNNKGDGKVNFKANRAAYKQNALQNFATNNDAVVNTRNASQYTNDKYCKLCQIRGHVMNSCSQFNTYNLRMERAKQLNL